jgi:hypothetical protein
MKKFSTGTSFNKDPKICGNSHKQCSTGPSQNCRLCHCWYNNKRTRLAHCKKKFPSGSSCNKDPKICGNSHKQCSVHRVRYIFISQNCRLCYSCYINKKPCWHTVRKNSLQEAVVTKINLKNLRIRKFLGLHLQPSRKPRAGSVIQCTDPRIRTRLNMSRIRNTAHKRLNVFFPKCRFSFTRLFC